METDTSKVIRQFESSTEQGTEELKRISRDLVDYLKEYTRDHPETAALFCFGVGFVLGWKLKPW